MTSNMFGDVLPDTIITYLPVFSILAICLFSYFVSRFILNKIISKRILQSKTRIDDVLHKNRVFSRISCSIFV